MTQHVVIVDDNDLSLKLLGSIASEIHDVVVHPFQSSNEALAWFEGEDVDCFIFDQHMPAPDGVEMIQRVRAMRRFALVPIVIVTGEHDRDVRYRAFDAGANDFVLKPLDFRELISRLKTLLALQAAQKQLAMQIGSLESRNLELAALNGELDSFTYSVSHDLRAPLRAIIGYACALGEDYAAAFDAEGQRLLSVVQNEASRMGALIDDLLALSRLGRQPLTRAAVDMTALVRDVVAEQLRLLKGSPLSIDLDDLPAAEGDRILLRQVWTNLISNAIKYSSKHEHPHVHVHGSLENGHATYHVYDNGVGFDMKYADKLFGVFQRLHRAEEFPGTGVGLAIVQRLVNRHGGTVWADARLGEGATFSFDFPIAGAT